jgi:hypothetical protein
MAIIKTGLLMHVIIKCNLECEIVVFPKTHSFHKELCTEKFQETLIFYVSATQRLKKNLQRTQPEANRDTSCLPLKHKKFF